VAGRNLIDELAAHHQPLQERSHEAAVGAGELLDAMSVAVELRPQLGAHLVVLAACLDGGLLRARGGRTEGEWDQNQRLPEAPPHSAAV
jgi:hypothetical protein